MGSAARTAHRLRLAAVLALGAFCLHQLRYLIAFGDSSSAELARQGHSYMADALPILVVFGLSALLATVIRGRYWRGHSQAPLLRRTPRFALALLAIFVTQESVEGLLAAGHAEGLAAVFAAGGWVVLPLALLLGTLAALVVRALEGIEVALAARRSTPRLPRAPRVRGRARVASPRLALHSPLAFGLARRPPPPLSA